MNLYVRWKTRTLLASAASVFTASDRLKVLLAYYPEWRIFFLSLLAGGWLLYGLPSAEAAAPVAVCGRIPPGHIGSGWYRSVLQEGLSWLLMTLAMMLPLLRFPVRHAAFSVRKKDQGMAVGTFLTGYGLIWVLVIPLFLLLAWTGVGKYGQALAFLAAAALLWYPRRLIWLSGCGLTAPIAISGPQLAWDSLVYGTRSGLACLRLCWLPMAAMAFVPHQPLLMYGVMVILIWERYFLPHRSKWPALAWLVLALASLLS